MKVSSITVEKMFLTPAEAGKIIGVTGVTVRTMLHEGVWKAPYIMSGVRMKIYAAPFYELIRTGTLATGLPTGAEIPLPERR